MSQPFFSVIVPSFNRAKFLPRCIESVQGQTFTDWELLIVDDGSSDNTREVVESYCRQDVRVRYIHQSNGRVSAARNTGLKHAKGRYLCFLDSDDAYDAGHLQFFFQELEKRNFGNLFLTTNFRYKDSTTDKEILAPVPKTYADKKLELIMRAYLPFSPCVQTICVPGYIKEKVSFDTRLNLSECYDFCARTAALVDDVVLFPNVTVTLFGDSDNASVPDGVDAAVRFNSRQYAEFLLMEKEPFYREIRQTKAFRGRLFYLQFELVKSALQKKQPVKFATAFLKALQHNPTYPFQVNYLKLGKKILRKVSGQRTPVPAV